MATCRVDGVELLEAQLAKLERGTIKRIVMAGAQAAMQEMIANTLEREHVGETGDMMRSIGPNEYREWLNGGSVEVYPQGDDSRGTRNATKAYVINYGRGKRPTTKRGTRNRTGDKFITGNERKTEAAVQAAMQAESDRLMDEIN